MKLDLPHRRYNLLTGEWVLVSPHRATRPWLGQMEDAQSESLPAFDPDCYLCPGNQRAGGKSNPLYSSTFVFDNDFPALIKTDAQKQSNDDTADRFYIAEQESGICRVVCFSPRHDLTLPELPHEQVIRVVQTWADQTEELGNLEFIHYVQVFENKGEIMGCSNPHPHSQIWATGHIPNEPAKELINQVKYQKQHGSCLLCDYLASEKEKEIRIIAANQHFTALIPFWAIWPFEVLLVSNRHCKSLLDLSTIEISALADIIQQITIRYDNLFNISFPYSMGFHQAPFDGANHDSWHFHAHYYPPLLRSATIKKFMVGFEMLAMPQRDLTPEAAALQLKQLDSIHYRKKYL
ncbi:MAG: UDP-glucose--hexose-1-phosphate uridylyltransferase [Anaerolineales bacterium]|nr:UDP-glucose--hexose-1-phosphate uridylyltransferase [Anaerolineales bacterium]